MAYNIFIYLILSFVFFPCLSICSQEIIKDTLYCDYSDLNGEKYYVETIRLTNYSQKDYLTWVNPYIITGISEDKIIRDYFRKSRGDLSFMHIMTDNVILKKQTIGSTFLKCIKSKETFEYIIIKKTHSTSNYRDRIFVVDRQHVEDYLIKIKEEYLFNQNEIILLDDIENK